VQNRLRKEEGVKNLTIGKKIGDKSEIKHKKIHLTRKGAKDGVQNRTISKR